MTFKTANSSEIFILLFGNLLVLCGNLLVFEVLHYLKKKCLISIAVLLYPVQLPNWLQAGYEAEEVGYGL